MILNHPPAIVTVIENFSGESKLNILQSAAWRNDSEFPLPTSSSPHETRGLRCLMEGRAENRSSTDCISAPVLQPGLRPTARLRTSPGEKKSPRSYSRGDSNIRTGIEDVMKRFTILRLVYVDSLQNSNFSHFGFAAFNRLRISSRSCFACQ